MMNNQNVVRDIRTVYEALTQYNTATAKSARSSRAGREIRVPCPIHNDKHPSCDLDLEKNYFICRVCGAGGDAPKMVILHRGLNFDKAGYTEAFGFLRSLDPMNIVRTKELPAWTHKGGKAGDKNVVRVTKRYTFTYTDEFGTPLYDEIRIEGFNADGERDKDVTQRRRLPEGGRWYRKGDLWVYFDAAGKPVPWGEDDPEPVSVTVYDINGKERRKPGGAYVYSMRGVKRVLYNLPGVIAAAKRGERIIGVEGPKKAELVMERLGFTATSANNGANADLEDSWPLALGGSKQYIDFADSDAVGRQASLRRALHFRRTVFDSRVIDFYNDDSHRDVADWLAERPNASRATLQAEVLKLINKAARL